MKEQPKPAGGEDAPGNESDKSKKEVVVHPANATKKPPKSKKVRDESEHSSDKISQWQVLRCRLRLWREQRAKSKRNRERARWTDRAMVFFTGGIVLLAVMQWRAMDAANQQTRIALHISERAYMNIGGPIFDLDKGVVGLPIINSGRIPSGEVEAIVHEATVNQTGTVTPIPLTNTVGKYWVRSVFPSVTPGNPINIAMTIHAFSKSQVENAEQIIFLAGTLSYNDGFPDDAKQEWPFCFESIRHLVLQQTIWTPCDAKTIIPILEGLDGYPNSQQNAN